ncbi:FHA domain-containing protein [Janibacter melonis]|uniref:FHA domain-containing protein n=1 Tax=Janibacter melonis TaxID=262209 RepID=A0A650GF08_9MICO|nr:FHA domain-containing protein [Janibacter melonis]QGX08564.1 FHA domain-containing protein [Janibacter melonis]
MELRIAALDDVPGWSVLRRPEVSLLLRGADEITARVAAALDERRGEDVVDVVVDTLTADGFRSTPDFALATPDGRLVARGAGEVRLGDDRSVVAGPRMPWRDEDAPDGVGEVTLAVVGVEAAPALEASGADAPAGEESPAPAEPAGPEQDGPAGSPVADQLAPVPGATDDSADDDSVLVQAPDEPVADQLAQEQPVADDQPVEPVAGDELVEQDQQVEQDQPAPDGPVEEPADPSTEEPSGPPADVSAAAPETESAAAPPPPPSGWAMPSVFGAASPPPPAPPSPVPPQDGDVARPTLTVVPEPEPEPVSEQPVVTEPAHEPRPQTGDQQQDAALAAGSAPTDEEEDELPSFDFLFGATSHHRSSLVAQAEEEDQIDSGPVAAAGGYQAPEDAAHATLAPPEEEHDEPEPVVETPAEPAPPAPPAPVGSPFDPPPATPEGTPPPPPPAGEDGLISAVPWGAGAAPAAPQPTAPEPTTPEPAGQEPPAPEPVDPEPSAPAEHEAPAAQAPEPVAPGAVPPPPVAPFGIGLPSAMPSFGTPTESGPRPLEPAQEHDPYAVPESTGPMVLAVRCPSGHASAPHAVSCRVCGAALPSQQPEPTPRPALGLLRLSTGDVVTLDRGVLIGRAPKSAPELPAAQAPHLVRVPSPDNEISRNHVEVILDGWHVLVRDLGSTNGTTITLPQDHPVRLRPGDQQSIEPGTTITLADQVSAVFEVTG